MYKVRAAAKQTATDKLRKILTRKNKSKNRFNSKPQRIKPAKRRKLTRGGAVRKQPLLIVPPPTNMTGWDKLLGNIKGTVKEESYDSDFDPEPPKKKPKLSQQKSKPKGKKKPPANSRKRKRKREQKRSLKKTPNRLKHNIVEQNNALKFVGIEYVISKNPSGKRSRRGWLCSTNN